MQTLSHPEASENGASGFLFSTPEMAFFAENMRWLSGFVEQVTTLNQDTGHYLIKVKQPQIIGLFLIECHAPIIYRGLQVDVLVDQHQYEAQAALLNKPAIYNYLVRPHSRQLNLELSCQKPLKAEQLKVKIPTIKGPLKKLLRSEAFGEMTGALASKITQAFTHNLPFILTEDPDRLLILEGVGPKRQRQIQSLWTTLKLKSEYKNFLFENELPLTWADTLFEFYGENGLKKFDEDPYLLAILHDFSFDRIDSYALYRGWSTHAPARVRAIIHAIIKQHYKNGHCATPERKVFDEIKNKIAISSLAIEEILELDIIEEKIVSEVIDGVPCLYLAPIWRLEREVAQSLINRKNGEPPWGWLNLNKVLLWAQELLHIQLAPLQKQAIETALSSRLTVITGGPGTGKTTLVRSLVTILKTQQLRVALCSPTGRAAQRLEQATRTPAQTIHRLLKYDGVTGEFFHNRHKPLESDLVLVDEMSMVDLELMWHLLEALPDHAGLILVGDSDQIPPVGAGTVLQSMIESRQFSTVKLTEVFRQGQNSMIKRNAHRIKSGLMPLTASTNSDFNFVTAHNKSEALNAVINLVTRTLPHELGETFERGPGPRNSKFFQILTPLNDGPLGALNLNIELQRVLNPVQYSSGIEISLPEVKQRFLLGDKVMVIKNDYVRNIFNGDIGFITRVDHRQRQFEVTFDNKTLQFVYEDLRLLTLAYAISIHKSQGSEYPTVIVVIGEEHAPMVKRNLIYTAITRAQKNVFLIAHPQTVKFALSSTENAKKWQRLTCLLAAANQDDSRQNRSDQNCKTLYF